MKRRIAVGIGLAGLFFLVGTTRVVYSSRKEYLKGRKALEMNIAVQAEAAGRIRTALSAYRAIRTSILGTRSFYTPHPVYLAKVNPRIAALMARQELELAAAAQRKRTKGRKRAQPRGTDGTEPSARKRDDERGPVPLDPKALDQRTAWHLRLLEKTHMPSVGWSLVALIGLFLWISSAFGFAYKAITPDDRLAGRQAMLWGGLILAGLVSWILGLALA